MSTVQKNPQYWYMSRLCMCTIYYKAHTILTRTHTHIHKRTKTLAHTMFRELTPRNEHIQCFTNARTYVCVCACARASAFCAPVHVHVHVRVDMSYILFIYAFLCASVCVCKCACVCNSDSVYI